MIEDEPLRIAVADLRTVCRTLLDHLEGIEPRVRLEKDYFWAIPKDDRYNVYDQPQDFTIGQLSESWQNLVNMSSSGSPVSYGLVWLADVLRAIGETVVQ